MTGFCPSSTSADRTSHVLRRWLDINGLTTADLVRDLECRAHRHRWSREELDSCLRWARSEHGDDPMPPRLLQAVFSHMEETLKDAIAAIRWASVLHQAGADLATTALREQVTRLEREIPTQRTAAGTAEPASASPGRRPDNLTPRERQVLQLLGLGQSNRRISRCLGLSEKTVKNYLSSLFAKLAVTDRTTAVLVALHHGYISLPPMARDLPDPVLR
ncbi:response regulator transcription factor [Actinosynnema sp. CS-041913]|uniref:helix-turn-helix transcriptional regulator n=1 Tax=Actinosynnema sp. CS-041913 TaxID=3239917 RepID=UPI003D908CE5